MNKSSLISKRDQYYSRGSAGFSDGLKDVKKAFALFNWGLIPKRQDVIHLKNVLKSFLYFTGIFLFLFVIKLSAE